MQISTPSDGRHVIPIVWYFAAHNAKTYRYVHTFGPGIWDREKIAQPPLLGEQPPYARPYYNGENVWGYTGQCVIGTPDQFLNGLSARELATNPPPKPACCQNNFPPFDLARIRFDLIVKTGAYAPQASMGRIGLSTSVKSWVTNYGPARLGFRFGLPIPTVTILGGAAPLGFQLGLVSTVTPDLQLGCQAWWGLHEGAGSVRVDSTGNGNDLVEGSAPVPNAPGLIGNAASFGPGLWLQSTFSAFGGLAAFTFSCWYNANGVGSNLWLEQASAPQTEMRTLFVFDQLLFGSTGCTTDPWTPGVWTHLVFTFDGLTVKAFKNGILATSLVVGPQFGGGGTTEIGGSNALTEWSDGLLQLFGVWNRALGDGAVAVGAPAGGEVALLYNSGAGLDWPL